jgi:hypothetical protein
MYVDALFQEWLSETKGIHTSATSHRAMGRALQARSGTHGLTIVAAKTATAACKYQLSTTALGAMPAPGAVPPTAAASVAPAAQPAPAMAPAAAPLCAALRGSAAAFAPAATRGGARRAALLAPSRARDGAPTAAAAPEATPAAVRRVPRGATVRHAAAAAPGAVPPTPRGAPAAQPAAAPAPAARASTRATPRARPGAAELLAALPAAALRASAPAALVTRFGLAAAISPALLRAALPGAPTATDAAAFAPAPTPGGARCAAPLAPSRDNDGDGAPSGEPEAAPGVNVPGAAGAVPTAAAPSCAHVATPFAGRRGPPLGDATQLPAAAAAIDAVLPAPRGSPAAQPATAPAPATASEAAAHVTLRARRPIEALRGARHAAAAAAGAAASTALRARPCTIAALRGAAANSYDSARRAELAGERELRESAEAELLMLRRERGAEGPLLASGQRALDALIAAGMGSKDRISLRMPNGGDISYMRTRNHRGAYKDAAETRGRSQRAHAAEACAAVARSTASGSLADGFDLLARHKAKPLRPAALRVLGIQSARSDPATSAAAFDASNMGCRQVRALARFSRAAKIPWMFASEDAVRAWRKALPGQDATYGVVDLKDAEGNVVEESVAFKRCKDVVQVIEAFLETYGAEVLTDALAGCCVFKANVDRGGTDTALSIANVGGVAQVLELALFHVIKDTHLAVNELLVKHMLPGLNMFDGCQTLMVEVDGKRCVKVVPLHVTLDNNEPVEVDEVPAASVLPVPPLPPSAARAGAAALPEAAARVAKRLRPRAAPDARAAAATGSERGAAAPNEVRPLRLSP